VAQGAVNPLAKPRTRSRAIRVMLDEMERLVDSRPLHVAVLQADAVDEAEEFRQMVEERFDCAELYVAEFTPVMGVHSGPGVLGLAFYTD
jgi:fatty acid-binding protein DegV